MAIARRYVALLRGINLGGRNRVGMARLREVVAADVGATEVETYIASGNVVFASALAQNALRARLERAIEAEFGISITVVILTAREMAEAVRANPFPDATPGSLHMAFANELISTADAARLAELDIHPEEHVVRGRWIYLYVPNGFGVAQLPKELDRRVRQPLTVRNFRTVTALNDMTRPAKSRSTPSRPARTDETRRRRVEKSAAALKAR